MKGELDWLYVFPTVQFSNIRLNTFYFCEIMLWALIYIAYIFIRHNIVEDRTI